MKKLALLIAFLAVTITVSAQQQKSFIEVTGVTAYKRTVEKYIVSVILSKDVLYNDELETYEGMKKKFLDKVKASQVAISKLREDEFLYLTTGYRKQGIVFVFETASKDELIRFMRIKSLGATMHNRNVVFKQTDIAILSKKAIENARQNAEKIAKNTGQSVGEIIALVDDNTIEIKEAIYDDNTESEIYYKLGVRFELLK